MHELTVQGFPVHRNGYIRKSVQAGIVVKQALAASTDAPDYWLRVIVARYLEKFYRDRKNGHPSADDLPYAIDSWVEDIGYNLTQECDAERVIRGFMLLSRSIRKWPQPCELLKAMPGRQIAPATASTAAIEPAADHDLASKELDNIMNMLNEG